MIPLTKPHPSIQAAQKRNRKALWRDASQAMMIAVLLVPLLLVLAALAALAGFNSRD